MNQKNHNKQCACLNVLSWRLLVKIAVIILVFYFVLNMDYFCSLYKTGNQNNHSPGSFNDVKSREILTLFVAIMSAPRRIERRNAVRTTWLKQCRLNGIPCLFFTDAQDMYGKLLPAKIRVMLEQENELHGDLILAQSPGGINFARRYLWMLNWASTRYKFDYFLRVDDDYFICMDRLLRELPYRQKRKLYWGYMHCNSPPGLSAFNKRTMKFLVILHAHVYLYS